MTMSSKGVIVSMGMGTTQLVAVRMCVGHCSDEVVESIVVPVALRQLNTAGIISGDMNRCRRPPKRC